MFGYCTEIHSVFWYDHLIGLSQNTSCSVSCSMLLQQPWPGGRRREATRTWFHFNTSVEAPMIQISLEFFHWLCSFWENLEFEFALRWGHYFYPSKFHFISSQILFFSILFFFNFVWMDKLNFTYQKVLCSLTTYQKFNKKQIFRAL